MFAFRGPAALQVDGSGDLGRVAGRDQESLFPAPEVDQGRATAAEQGLGERDVVGAVAVQQVDRRAVGIAACQHPDSLKTAAGADGDHRGSEVGSDMVEDDLQGWVVAAGQPEGTLRLEEPGRGQGSIRCDPGSAALTEDDHAVLGQASGGAVDRRRGGAARQDSAGDRTGDVEVLGHERPLWGRPAGSRPDDTSAPAPRGHSNRLIEVVGGTQQRLTEQGATLTRMGATSTHFWGCSGGLVSA